tara:strand:- start:606 stop:854 length:249 start_codon:yes stop_codon:yes gene_type:complete
VTPQSHRVHHSPILEHRDTNFGLTFSIWDHIFGTQYRNYDEYPITGIHDEGFPTEQDEPDKNLAKLVLDQFIYPFRMVATRL